MTPASASAFVAVPPAATTPTVTVGKPSSHSAIKQKWPAVNPTKMDEWPVQPKAIDNRFPMVPPTLQFMQSAGVDDKGEPLPAPVLSDGGPVTEEGWIVAQGYARVFGCDPTDTPAALVRAAEMLYAGVPGATRSLRASLHDPLRWGRDEGQGRVFGLTGLARPVYGPPKLQPRNLVAAIARHPGFPPFTDLGDNLTLEVSSGEHIMRVSDALRTELRQSSNAKSTSDLSKRLLLQGSKHERLVVLLRVVVRDTDSGLVKFETYVAVSVDGATRRELDLNFIHAVTGADFSNAWRAGWEGNDPGDLTLDHVRDVIDAYQFTGGGVWPEPTSDAIARFASDQTKAIAHATIRTLHAPVTIVIAVEPTDAHSDGDVVVDLINSKHNRDEQPTAHGKEDSGAFAGLRLVSQMEKAGFFTAEQSRTIRAGNPLPWKGDADTLKDYGFADRITMNATVLGKFTVDGGTEATRGRFVRDALRDRGLAGSTTRAAIIGASVLGRGVELSDRAHRDQWFAATTRSHDKGSLCRFKAGTTTWLDKVALDADTLLQQATAELAAMPNPLEGDLGPAASALVVKAMHAHATNPQLHGYKGSNQAMSLAGHGNRLKSLGYADLGAVHPQQYMFNAGRSTLGLAHLHAILSACTVHSSPVLPVHDDQDLTEDYLRIQWTQIPNSDGTPRPLQRTDATSSGDGPDDPDDLDDDGTTAGAREGQSLISLLLRLAEDGTLLDAEVRDHVASLSGALEDLERLMLVPSVTDEELTDLRESGADLDDLDEWPSALVERGVPAEAFTDVSDIIKALDAWSTSVAPATYRVRGA